VETADTENAGTKAPFAFEIELEDATGARSWKSDRIGNERHSSLKLLSGTTMKMFPTMRRHKSQWFEFANFPNQIRHIHNFRIVSTDADACAGDPWQIQTVIVMIVDQFDRVRVPVFQHGIVAPVPCHAPFTLPQLPRHDWERCTPASMSGDEKIKNIFVLSQTGGGTSGSDDDFALLAVNEELQFTGPFNFLESYRLFPNNPGDDFAENEGDLHEFDYKDSRLYVRAPARKSFSGDANKVVLSSLFIKSLGTDAWIPEKIAMLAQTERGKIIPLTYDGYRQFLFEDRFQTNKPELDNEEVVHFPLIKDWNKQCSYV